MTALYDDVAEDYARLIAPKYRPIAALVADRLPARLDGVVVELAVGTGLLTSLLAQRLSARSSYLAIDESAGMLDVARRHLPSCVELSVADVCCLPVPDGAASYVVSSLGPVQDSVEALAEARRVLRPGGRLVFTAWGDDYAELALLQRARARLGVAPYPAGRVADISTRLAAAGFAGASVEEVVLDVVHDSVEDYVAYRSSFGAPPWLEPSRHHEVAPAIRAEASRHVDGRGRVRLDWRVAVVTATR